MRSALPASRLRSWDLETLTVPVSDSAAGGLTGVAGVVVGVAGRTGGAAGRGAGVTVAVVAPPPVGAELIVVPPEPQPSAGERKDGAEMFPIGGLDAERTGPYGLK